MVPNVQALGGEHHEAGRRRILASSGAIALVVLLLVWAGETAGAATSRGAAPTLRAASGARASSAPAASAWTPITSGPTLAGSGWFLQVSSLAPDYPVSTVVGWIGAACALPPAQRPALVLQDVVGPDGQLAVPYLDALAPYLPGGRLHCISRVYVGTEQPQWTGAGSPYWEGIECSLYRYSYVSETESIAAAFAARYPYLQFDWYIPYEANLNYLFYPQIESGYASLLRGEEAALNGVRAGRAFLWSPAFWYPWSSYSGNAAGMAGLTQNLSGLFAALAATGHPFEIDLQDFVAGSSCQPPSNRMTPSDAVGWIRYLAAVPRAPRVEMNVEQYQIADCATGGLVPGDFSELAARRATYLAAGVSLGPSFEIRYAEAGGP
jgi:hypothetical protein